MRYFARVNVMNSVCDTACADVLEEANVPVNQGIPVWDIILSV